MPQTNSAKKALRVANRKRVVNDRWRKKYRAAVKAVKDAVAAGEQNELPALHKTAQSLVDRAARRNILHQNKAARVKASLAKLIA